MGTDTKAHWEAVYRDKAVDAVSWFQPSPARSLQLIRACEIAPDAPIIDMGGGASRLVDALLEAGYTDVSVLDIAAAALEKSRSRLGADADRVAWLVADATTVTLPKTYQLWHDRAVFHFLTDTKDRAAYLERLDIHLAPGGHLIIAGFAPEGPSACSGLPVRRYDEAALGTVLGPAFEHRDTISELHRTPGGAEQAFLYHRYRRRA